MKIAVISDIHANMSAFEKVLEDIEANAIDDIICLGDCIGYGPEPEQVVSEIRRRQIPTIIGNHELAAFKKDLIIADTYTRQTGMKANAAP